VSFSTGLFKAEPNRKNLLLRKNKKQAYVSLNEREKPSPYQLSPEDISYLIPHYQTKFPEIRLIKSGETDFGKSCIEREKQKKIE